jgi:long-chain acyl-CoA synthetase
MDEASYLATLRRLWAEHWPASVPRDPIYPFGEILLTDYLRRRAADHPDKTAVIFYGTDVSYGELDRLSDAFASLLAQHGVKQGNRVAVFLPNCPQFLIAFYGILKLGCIHVPVNPMFKEHELLYELQDTDAVAIVAQDQLMPLVRAVAAKTSLRLTFATSLAEMLPAEPTIPVLPVTSEPKRDCPDAADLMPALRAVTTLPPAVTVRLDDTAALNYTGGTTGMPKGCVHTQRDMIYTAATALTCGNGLQPADLVLNFQPVFWIAGENTGVILPVFAGVTLILLARWDPLAWLEAVQHYRVTTAGMLVDNAVAIMEHPDVGRYDLRCLRGTRVSSFVKKLNEGYRRRWFELTGATMIEAAWGMTETHTMDTFTTGQQDDDFDLKSQPIFVGLPVPGTEFKICAFETGELQPLGTEGEIVVRSPSQLKSYWNKPEATEAAFRDGWFHTGDIGMLDTDGFLHFLGRRKEMLKVNGMSVFPAEIEALLGQHPAVIGSGVIGRPDEARGQTPVAFVLADPASGLTPESLVAWCRENMATYKVPSVHLVDELPMTATGKVKKEELSRLLV